MVNRPLIEQGRFALYLLAISLLAIRWNGAFPLDDAYIVLHNARALLRGTDGLYHTSPLTGSTSPVHLLLVAGAGLAMPLPIASFLVGAAGAVAYALGLDRLVRQAGATGWYVPLLVLTGLLGDVAPLQLLNGLETSLAAATVAWLLVLADGRRLGLLAGVAPFVRPELGLLSLLLLARRRWTLGLSPMMRDCMTAGIVALPLGVWMLVATGHLVPQTAYAKALFFAEGGWPVAQKLQILAETIMISGFAPLFIGLLATRKAEWPGAVFVVGLLAIGMATIPSAMGWNYCRYLVPMLPVLLSGLARLSGDLRGRIIVLLATAVSLLLLSYSLPMLDRELAYWKREERDVSALTARLPAGSVVLIHDAGLVAWTGRPLYLVDVVGLKTPASIEQHHRFTRNKCDYGAALDRIAANHGARYALVLPSVPWSCIATSLVAQGWHLKHVAAPSHYQLFELSPPSRITQERPSLGMPK